MGPWLSGIVPMEGILVWHLCSSLCTTTLPARGFSLIVLVRVLHQRGNEGGACWEKKVHVHPKGWWRPALLWISCEIRLWGGRECAEWNMCSINRRLQSWEVCGVDFSGFPAYSQISYPFSLSSSASVATKGILTPHKWLEQGALPLRVSTAGWKIEVFFPGKGWRESMFAFPLKFSVSLWNNIKHNIYVKNENLWNKILLQYEHLLKKEAAELQLRFFKLLKPDSTVLLSAFYYWAETGL